MKLIKLLFLLFFTLSADHAWADAATNPDNSLITPGATVLAYCNSKVFDQGSKYFNLEPVKQDNPKPIQLNWKNCRIVSEELTKLVGKKVETNRVAEKADVEVTLEVGAADKEGKYHLQRYWFLLHHYPVGWQIVSYNLVDD